MSYTGARCHPVNPRLLDTFHTCKSSLWLLPVRYSGLNETQTQRTVHFVFTYIGSNRVCRLFLFRVKESADVPLRGWSVSADGTK